MLTQLSTVKTRLALLDTDPTYDALLTSAIKSLSARFYRDCNRSFARAVDTTFEFDASDTEIIPPCYPIESVKNFALKTDEAEGWVPQPQPAFLIRKSCIISLAVPLSQQTTLTQIPLAQITYTGGYVLPGMDPLPGQTALPADIEDAVVEQIASGSSGVTNSASTPTGHATPPTSNGPSRTSSPASKPPSPATAATPYSYETNRLPRSAPLWGFTAGVAFHS